jgi:hypothetical protein
MTRTTNQHFLGHWKIWPASMRPLGGANAATVPSVRSPLPVITDGLYRMETMPKGLLHAYHFRTQGPLGRPPVSRCHLATSVVDGGPEHKLPTSDLSVHAQCPLHCLN